MDDGALASIGNDFLEYQYEVLGVKDFLASPDVTEICINRPGELIDEVRGKAARGESTAPAAGGGVPMDKGAGEHDHFGTKLRKWLMTGVSYMVPFVAAGGLLIALSFDSREEVDAIVAKAVAAGGRTYSEPKDHGFMYQHGFQDLDGHVWEVFWMEPNASPAT